MCDEVELSKQTGPCPRESDKRDLGQESAAQGHSQAQPVSSLVTGSRPRPRLYVLAELLSRDNGSGAKEL